MNIYSYIKDQVLKACNLTLDFSVETPKFANQGDVSLNIAFLLSKERKKGANEIANELLPFISNLEFVKKSEALNGFINIFLKEEFLYKAFLFTVNKGYGNENLGKGEKINIEYCSANPTGPIHIGHTRGTIYGDVTAELLSKNGFDVTREFYINDAGGQIQTLLKSVLIRIRQLQGESIEIPEGCYPGEYLIDVAKKVLTEFKNKVLNETTIKDFVINEMMLSIKADLLKLNVKHDVFTSEQQIINSGEVEKSIEVLTEKGLVYKGILPKPKGKLTEEWEEREQTLFKSTEFGDSEDRALKKSDGSNTYFTSDIAYHKNKLDRGFYNIMLVLGADHLGYITRITAATKALSAKPLQTKVEVKACQIVKFLENGEAIKMSKRKGTFTTLAEVLEEVHPDILRFVMLTKKNDSHMDFDLIKVKEQTKENPIFYIQYAYSRACSVLKNANIQIKNPNVLLLKENEELDFIKKALEFPKVIETATKKLEPHLISNYLYELASIFHSLWNIGREEEKRKFITENIEETQARLFLVSSLINIINSAFSIFKITPLKEM